MRMPIGFENLKPGDKVICTQAGWTRLKHHHHYTVVDLSDLGPPTRLIEVEEIPGVLFHPGRFIRICDA